MYFYFFQLVFGIVIRTISFWYPCAPQNLSKSIWVCCSSLFPTLFILFYQISIFGCLYGCIVVDGVFNEVKCCHFFIQIISNNHPLFNCVDSGWFFFSNYLSYYVDVIYDVFPSSCVLYVPAWCSINLPHKRWFLCIFGIIIITF